MNKINLEPILSKECEFCDQPATTTWSSVYDTCEDCKDNCTHDEIECGECQDCGRHVSDFMDEDCLSDR